MLPLSANILRDLSRFGTLRNQWQGQGLLHRNGQDPVPISFLIGQESDGRLIFACESDSPDFMHMVIEDRIPPLQEAELSVNDGSTASIDGNYWVVHTSSNVSQVGRNTVLIAFLTGLTISSPGAFTTPMSITFELVNFLFTGTEPVETVVGTTHATSLALMRLNLEGNQVSLNQVEHYDRVEKELRAQGSIQVTATATIDIADPAQVDYAIGILDRLTDVMTICRGTVVSWTAYHLQDRASRVVRTHFKHAVVKDYSSFELIPRSSPHASQSFLEVAHHRHLELDHDFQIRRLARGYAETRGGPFLETRGMLVGVLLEYLSATRARLEGHTTIMPDAVFSEGLAQLQQLLANASRSVFPNIAPEQLQAISVKAVGLNYRSLRSTITALCRWIELQPPPGAVNHFVEARNSLAHRGQFPEGQDPIRSFLRMMHLLDLVVLRLLGYSGPYIHAVTREVTHL